MLVGLRRSLASSCDVHLERAGFCNLFRFRGRLSPLSFYCPLSFRKYSADRAGSSPPVAFRKILLRSSIVSVPVSVVSSRTRSVLYICGYWNTIASACFGVAPVITRCGVFHIVCGIGGPTVSSSLSVFTHSSLFRLPVASSSRFITGRGPIFRTVPCAALVVVANMIALPLGSRYTCPRRPSRRSPASICRNCFSLFGVISVCTRVRGPVVCVPWLCVRLAPRLPSYLPPAFALDRSSGLSLARVRRPLVWCS